MQELVIYSEIENVQKNMLILSQKRYLYIKVNKSQVKNVFIYNTHSMIDKVSDILLSKIS